MEASLKDTIAYQLNLAGQAPDASTVDQIERDAVAAGVAQQGGLFFVKGANGAIPLHEFVACRAAGPVIPSVTRSQWDALGKNSTRSEEQRAAYADAFRKVKAGELVIADDPKPAVEGTPYVPPTVPVQYLKMADWDRIRLSGGELYKQVFEKVKNKEVVLID